jgi:hypothetical protein
MIEDAELQSHRHPPLDDTTGHHALTGMHGTALSSH